MITLLVCGAISLFTGVLWGIGIVAVFLGIAMFKGFRELSPANPREEGLITFLGTRTKTRVRGLVLLLDWLPFDIVGVSAFNMQKVDKNFPIPSVRCYDGVRVGGTMSISLSPDEDNLGDYDDAQRMDGIHAQIDEMVIAWVQEIAAESDHDYKWMETNPKTIADRLAEKMNELKPKGTPVLGGITGLGVKINKLQIKLTPNNADVIKADESLVFETLDRKGQELDTETINRQVEKRYQMYLAQWIDDGRGGPKPSKEKCRKEIFDERLAKVGKYTKMVNEGGVNVNEMKGTP